MNNKPCIPLWQYRCNVLRLDLLVMDYVAKQLPYLWINDASKKAGPYGLAAAYNTTKCSNFSTPYRYPYGLWCHLKCAQWVMPNLKLIGKFFLCKFSNLLPACCKILPAVARGLGRQTDICGSNSIFWNTSAVRSNLHSSSSWRYWGLETWGGKPCWPFASAMAGERTCGTGGLPASKHVPDNRRSPEEGPWSSSFCQGNGPKET